MRDLYCIGEMVIDFIPGIEPGSYVRNPGGAPANVAVAASRQGLRSAMCCSLGDDDFGRFLLSVLRENNVEPIRETLCKEAITTMAFVTLDESGDRRFTFARKPGADMFLSEDDVRKEDIAESVIVHAGSCSLSASPEAEATEKALRLASAYDRFVSFDLNYRDLMWNGDFDACAIAVRRILPYVDALKLSEEEAELFCAGETIPQMMERFGISAVVETLGADGARCFYKGESFDVPGRKAVCVDATGAGDAFWGGFLSALRIGGLEKPSDLTRELLVTALEYGNKCGWFCVQKKGAMSSLPTRAEAEALA
ncbi:MAG: carbohydrate kinase [Oscillospiraceae bacterium]|nr:carbohydrate kinase [Oscillospiraceae bacterium]